MKKEYYEGLDKLHLRATLKALGIPLDKSVIAVISAQNATVLGNAELETVTKQVCEGIASAGAVAKIMYLPSFSDATVYGSEQAKYEILLRNTIANEVQMIAGQEFLSGIVFVASNTVSVVGMLMGAIRLNLPCMFVSGGVMSPFLTAEGQKGYNHWYSAVGKIRAGILKLEDSGVIENTMPQFLGVDCEQYEPNSVNCMMEVLGLALEGNCTVMSASRSRNQIAFNTGRAVVFLIEKNITLENIITNASLSACAAFNIAAGGCPSNLLHILAVAGEAKRKWNIKTVDLSKIESLCKKVPLLYKEKEGVCFTQAFALAGGVYALLKELKTLSLIDCDYPYYGGDSLNALIEKERPRDDNVILDGKNPLLPYGKIRVLYGNIAEKGAVATFDGVTNSFIGPAKVYENEESLTYAVLDREIKKGTVIVVRNEGPRSAPGMRELIQPLALLKALGLGKDVAVVTDGKIPADYDGFAVGHITPETVDMGLIALLQDGDVIEINIGKGKISADIKAKEIERRKPSVNVTFAAASNMLKLHASIITPATNGCIDKDV